MNFLTIFEFDKIFEKKENETGTKILGVPSQVFAWLESQCLERRSDGKSIAWAKLTQSNGQRCVQFDGYAGVVRAPCGFQIEVLPKTGKNTKIGEARALFIKMLKCLQGFRHIEIAPADLSSERMPLLDVFIRQFLLAVGALVKRGLRSDYVSRQDNLFALRGKLLVGQQIVQNLVRRDRFFTAHDEFSQDRAENRLIHAALRQVLTQSRSSENQRMAREYSFVFAEVPLPVDVSLDIQKIRLGRGMNYYEPALDWAKLILKGLSPTSGMGGHHAPSLLFQMSAMFESYVAKHLTKQLHPDFDLQAQAQNQYLVKHETHDWFRLKPDLLVKGKDKQSTPLVLDTKWKILDAEKNNGTDKYNLSESDFYQMYAYGHHYLTGQVGDIVLIYPKTDTFQCPLPVFDFPHTAEMCLWVLPFDLKSDRLVLPKSLPSQFQSIFLDSVCPAAPTI